MSNRGWWIAGGVGAAVLLWWLLPNWIAGLLIVALVAAPVVGYLVLDPSQRRRLKRIRERRQLGN